MDQLYKILNANNVESRHFISFCLPPNIMLEEKSCLNEWIERMMFLYEDVKWLLSRTVVEFWNQIIFDDSWSICLDSFLENAPRSFDVRNLPDGCKTAMSRVSRLFLLTLKRMSTYNGEETIFPSIESFGAIIYENYLFDAAKLFDICAVFYRPNCGIEEILEEMFGNIFADITMTLQMLWKLSFQLLTKWKEN